MPGPTCAQAPARRRSLSARPRSAVAVVEVAPARRSSTSRRCRPPPPRRCGWRRARPRPASGTGRRRRRSAARAGRRRPNRGPRATADTSGASGSAAQNSSLLPPSSEQRGRRAGEHPEAGRRVPRSRRLTAPTAASARRPEVGDRVLQALSSRNSALPATRTLAPAAAAPATVAGPMPPSTSMSTSRPPLDDQRPQLGDLGLHDGDVGLAAEAGVDRHDQHHVDEVEHVRDGRDRGGRVEGDGRAGAQLADAAERAVQVRGGLGVDDERARSRPRRSGRAARRARSTIRWASNGTVACLPAGGDDVGPEGEVGHEAAVHHVPLDAVDARLLQGAALLAQPGEVGREHGRDDRDRPGRRATPQRYPSARSIQVVVDWTEPVTG